MSGMQRTQMMSHGKSQVMSQVMSQRKSQRKRSNQSAKARSARVTRVTRVTRVPRVVRGKKEKVVVTEAHKEFYRWLPNPNNPVSLIPFSYFLLVG